MTHQPDEAGQRPFQFSIRSLMMLTAAVAVFFALATQLPFIFGAIYFHLVFLLLTIKSRTRLKGILVLNHSIFNCYVFPTIIFYVQMQAMSMLMMSALIALVFSLVLLMKDTGFNKISGGLCSMTNLMLMMFLIGMGKSGP